MTRLLSLMLALLLAGCAASGGGTGSAYYDFGPSAPAAPVKQKLTQLVVAEATGPAPLDSAQILYRLHYADQHQARAYANSQWNSSPLQLLTQHVRQRVAENGVAVLGLADARTGAPVLKMDVLEFSHDFPRAASSEGRVSVRATLFAGQKLLAQRTFTHTRPAGSLDAAGGVAALVQASDALTAELLQWLASYP